MGSSAQPCAGSLVVWTAWSAQWRPPASECSAPAIEEPLAPEGHREAGCRRRSPTRTRGRAGRFPRVEELRTGDRERRHLRARVSSMPAPHVKSVVHQRQGSPRPSCSTTPTATSSWRRSMATDAVRPRRTLTLESVNGKVIIDASKLDTPTSSSRARSTAARRSARAPTSSSPSRSTATWTSPPTHRQTVAFANASAIDGSCCASTSSRTRRHWNGLVGGIRVPRARSLRRRTGFRLHRRRGGPRVPQIVGQGRRTEGRQGQHQGGSRFGEIKGGK